MYINKKNRIYETNATPYRTFIFLNFSAFIIFFLYFVKEILNKRANEIIVAFINLSNNLLKKHKKLVKKNLLTPSRKGSSWWNEILIYDASIKEIFVMSRASKKDLEWGDSKQKASLEKLISTATGDNPITIGTPAKYRKWYTDRKGKLDVY